MIGVNVPGIPTVRSAVDNHWSLCPLEVLTRSRTCSDDLGNSSGDRTTLKVVEGTGSYSCIDMLSKAVPTIAFQVVDCALQLWWGSCVQYEAGTQLLGNTYCIEQLTSWW